MNLILCGFKGCGKSHFGKRFAEKKKLQFIDTDHLLEAEHHESCSALMQRIGPSRFREKEAAIIQSVATLEPTVIALGGGALLHPASAEILSRLGKVVYLQIEKSLLKTRLLAPPLPAFLDPEDLEGSFEKMYQERVHLYEALATAIIIVDMTDEEQILSELERLYGQ
jgi:shikimate kinase